VFQVLLLLVLLPLQIVAVLAFASWWIYRMLLSRGDSF